MIEAQRPGPRWWPFAVGLPLLAGALIAAKVSASGPHDPRLLVVYALGALLIACAIWVVPPSWAISAGLVLTMFGGNWQALGLPSSVAPDRLVLGIALIAIAARGPRARDRPAIRFRPIYAVMYVAGAYAVGSAIAVGTIFQHAALFDLFDRMQIFQWVLFVIAPAAFSTPADRRVFIGTLVGMGLYLGFTGIFEIIGPHALVFPRYIMNPHVGVHFGRARGPFVQAAVNGLALYACIAASLIALREWRARWVRLLACLGIAVCSFSLLLTFQRTIWIGVAIASLVVLIAARELRRYVIPILATVAVVVALAFLLIPSVRAHASLRAADVTTVQNREALDAAALAMVEARPLFGFGWGRFLAVAPNYFKESDSYSINEVAKNPVHDVYGSIATELGLVGLALWLWVLFWGVGGAIVSRRVGPEMRPFQVALGAIFLLWLIAGISSPLESSFQSVIIWLWAAVIVGAEADARARRRPGVKRPVSWPRPALPAPEARIT
jgi:putative inorganic carbon (hco3(-)) transporter